MCCLDRLQLSVPGKLIRGVGEESDDQQINSSRYHAKNVVDEWTAMREDAGGESGTPPSGTPIRMINS